MMEEELSTGGNTLEPGSNHGNAGSNNFYIVGYNMLALIIYTLALKFSKDLAGYFVDAFLLVIHVLVCIVLAIGAKGSKVWMWVLSAVLVLVIGVSTCVVIPPFLK
jgi:hypothetical protein